MIFACALFPMNADAAKSTSTITNSEIKNLENEKAEAQNEVNELGSELVDLMAEVDALEQQIAANQAEIDQATQDIADAEEAEAQQFEMMKKRIRYIYENDDKNILTIFCESSSFSDFLDKVAYTNSIYESDKQMMDSYEATKIEIQGMKEELESNQLSLESQKKDLAAKQSSLNTMIAQKKQEVADFDAKIKTARAEAKKKAAAAAKAAAAKKAAENAAKVSAKKAAEAAKKAAENTASNTTTTTDTGSTTTNTTSDSGGGGSTGTTESLNPAPRTSISGSSVVAYANQFVGNPYVWGGNSLTEGIDCSGFIVEVYKNFGINLSGYRNSASLRSVGQAVSYENIQAGDIICYPGHVGIAMGNGCIVEAQSKATGITNYRSYTCHPILAIRRVI